jgi:hypothetical protein
MLFWGGSIIAYITKTTEQYAFFKNNSNNTNNFTTLVIYRIYSLTFTGGVTNLYASTIELAGFRLSSEDSTLSSISSSASSSRNFSEVRELKRRGWVKPSLTASSSACPVKRKIDLKD